MESTANPPVLGRSGTALLLVLAVALVGGLLLGHRQALTGDEPRYLMYAISILEHGRFVMTGPEWDSLWTGTTGLPSSGLPEGAGGVVLLNGVYVPALLSPVAVLFGLAGLRAATLAVGLAGLFFVWRLCGRVGSRGSALFAVAVAGLSIPLLPYLHLFYMETFLFALLAWGWDRLQTAERPAWGHVLTAAILLAIPFAHLRGSVVAASLYALLLWQMVAQRRFRLAAGLAALAAGALAVLVLLNLGIYGSITGPINTARPPTPSQWLDVLSMQSFNVRHGLIAYAPVWLLGYAGLWAGAVAGPSPVRQGLALAVIAAITGVGVNPGECWPARFWVLSIPMLAVGFCFWWERARALTPRALGLVLVGFTLANTVLFFRVPDLFLENRQTTATYQVLYALTGRLLHFGLMLPVEADDGVNTGAAYAFAAGAAVFIVSAALAAIRGRSIYAIPAALLLVAWFDLARVTQLPTAQYRTAASRDALEVRFDPAALAGYVQLGRQWQTWFSPPDWPRFTVTATGASGGTAAERSAAGQVIAGSCRTGLSALSVSGTGQVDLAEQAGYRLIAYRSRSWLRATLPMLREAC